MGELGLRRNAALALAGFVLTLVALAPAADAGTTGKLTGRVLDPKKQPLTGANVNLVGVPLGAATDADGRFIILNVPAGTYSVKVSLIGYRAVVTEGVAISADNSTALDVTLAESPLELSEVVVSAKRPVIDVNLTSNVQTVTRDQIKSLPVQELQDVVNLQAGVVDGHFRGGRAGEVQYQVDGVTVNNVYDNTSSIRLDRSLLEEVQVISGTFDAEYGQAMSGVVNAVLRRAAEKFSWSGEAFSGGFLYRGASRLQVFDLHPAGIQNYQLMVTGPTPLPNTLYLLSARRYVSDDYVDGTRLFRTTDRRDSTGAYHPSGDGAQVPLGNSREWSGLARLTNRSIQNIELNYQAIWSSQQGRRSDFMYRFDPDGLSRQRTFSIVHGLDFTHTLNKSTYYKVTVRQNYFDYRDMAYDNLWDPRYNAGPPRGDPNNALGAFTQGVDFTRFRQTTSAPVFDGSFVSQITRAQLVKIGGEYQVPRLRFGHPGSLVFTQEGGNETLNRYVDRPPDYPGVREYRPILAAAYGQDDVEWNDIRLRAGLRFEYFNPRSALPGDLGNPANTISGVPQSEPRATTRKISLMPRIGVSYPITSRSAVFFAYGHFTQLPSLGDAFGNADYSVLANLQASDNVDRYGVLGNPDVKPEKTVQYQFGYKQALSDVLGLDLTVFYKDIRDLLGVEFISTYNDAEYARLTNVDFGNVTGFTISLDQRAIGLFSSSLDYTFQVADGNSSDPRETATRAAAGEDPRPRLVPLNWDQRHTLNLTLELANPDRFSLSAIVRAASGQPYTPTISAIFGGGLEANSGRKPNVTEVDLRGEKNLSLGGVTGSLFGRVFNLFDTRFFNGFVFQSSGSPYYSSNSAADLTVLADPTRFYGPRRIELGLSFQGGRR